MPQKWVSGVDPTALSASAPTLMYMPASTQQPQQVEADVLCQQLAMRKIEGLPPPSTMAPSQRRLGLTQVSPAAQDSDLTREDPDIVAIHGLDTHSSDTWIWRSHEEPTKNVNWLEDPCMLPEAAGKQSRIFTFDWSAELFRTSLSLPLTLRECATLLLASLRDMTRPKDRPLIFIASCFGGIVLMEALVIASQRTAKGENEYDFVRRATRGVVFLATPFRGTSFANIADWALPILQAKGFLAGERVATLLESVREASSVEELVASFTQLCLDHRYVLHLHSFYETEKTVLAYRVLPRWAQAVLPGAAKQVCDLTSLCDESTHHW
jgi:hypothetical protein